jgi:hypothetical protein
MKIREGYMGIADFMGRMGVEVWETGVSVL